MYITEVYFYSYFADNFYLECVLNFIKYFSCFLQRDMISYIALC